MLCFCIFDLGALDETLYGRQLHIVPAAHSLASFSPYFAGCLGNSIGYFLRHPAVPDKKSDSVIAPSDRCGLALLAARRAPRGGQIQGSARLKCRFVACRLAFLPDIAGKSAFSGLSPQRQKAHCLWANFRLSLFSARYSVWHTSGSSVSLSGSLQSVKVSSNSTNLRTKSTSSAAISSSPRSAKKSVGTPRL